MHVDAGVSRVHLLVRNTVDLFLFVPYLTLMIHCSILFPLMAIFLIHSVKGKQLHLFWLFAQVDSRQDHHRVISTSFRPPLHWTTVSCYHLVEGIDADL